MRLAIEGTTFSQLRQAVPYSQLFRKLVQEPVSNDWIVVSLPTGQLEIGILTSARVPNVARFTGPAVVLGAQLDRLVSAILSSPGATPVADEYWMFLARSAAVRSSSVRMGVGAALVRDGSLLAVGTNEVPVVGGGLAWSDDENESRDFASVGVPGLDRRAIVLAALGWEESIAAAGPQSIVGNQLLGLVDVERAIHAEVAAITDAGRRGVPTRSATMYVTHHPCYRCERLLTAAGIERVVFDEEIAWKVTTEMLRLLKSPTEVVPFEGLRWNTIEHVRAALAWTIG